MIIQQPLINYWKWGHEGVIMWGGVQLWVTYVRICGLNSTPALHPVGAYRSQPVSDDGNSVI